MRSEIENIPNFVELMPPLIVVLKAPMAHARTVRKRLALRDLRISHGPNSVFSTLKREKKKSPRFTVRLNL